MYLGIRETAHVLLVCRDLRSRSREKNNTHTPSGEGSRERKPPQRIQLTNNSSLLFFHAKTSGGMTIPPVLGSRANRTSIFEFVFFGSSPTRTQHIPFTFLVSYCLYMDWLYTNVIIFQLMHEIDSKSDSHKSSGPVMLKRLPPALGAFPASSSLRCLTSFSACLGLAPLP